MEILARGQHMRRQAAQDALVHQPLDQMPPAKPDALPRDHGLHHQHVIVDPQPLGHPPPAKPRRPEPVGPCRSRPERLFQMDQAMGQQRLRLLRHLVRSQIARPADRINFLGGQGFGVVLRPVFRIPAADRERNPLAQQIEVTVRRLDAQVDMRQRLAQRGHARHHPEGGEGGRTGQRHMPSRGHRAQILRRPLDMRQADAHIGMEPLARLGQSHAPVLAQEQRHTQLLFQTADRIGHGRLRHVQLAGGPRKTGEPSRRLEDDKGVDRRQQTAQAFHKHSLSNQ